MIYYLGLCKISPQGVVLCKHIHIMKYDWRPNHKLFIGLLQIKQSQNKKGTKMVSFFTVNRWEKNTIFGAAEKKSVLLILTGLELQTVTSIKWHIRFMWIFCKRKLKIDIMFEMPLFLIHLWSEATKNKVCPNHPFWYQISRGVRILILFFAQRSWSECNC